MGSRISRRAFIAAVGTGTATLAGCGGGIGQPQTSTTARPGTVTNSGGETPKPTDHGRMVGAYYYPWYSSSYPMRDWSPAKPELGYYRSTDETVINQHVKWAREYGINWLSISWARGGSWGHGRFIEDHFLPATYGREIEFSLLYESDPELQWRDGVLDFGLEDNRTQLQRDFQKFEKTYFSEPTYATLDGRPVLTMYTATDFGGDVAGALQAAVDTIDTDPYLVACVLGSADVTGPMQNVQMGWLDEFDAVTGYNLYDRQTVAAAEGEFDAYLSAAGRALDEWSLVADHASLHLIPDIFPGYNDTHISDRDHHSPVLHRDPEGFRELAAMGRDHMDPEIDAVLITSFNEWPEYTAVEPSADYGTTYLKIVQTELAQATPDYFEPDRHPTLQFRFQDILAPPNAGDADPPLEFGMQADALELTVNGDTVSIYDIGTPPNEPYLLEGAYPAKRQVHNGMETWRWFGGPTGQATIALDPRDRDATKGTVRGMAPGFGERPVTADIYLDGRLTDTVTLQPEVKGYEFSLNV